MSKDNIRYLKYNAPTLSIKHNTKQKANVSHTYLLTAMVGVTAVNERTVNRFRSVAVVDTSNHWMVS